MTKICDVCGSQMGKGKCDTWECWCGNVVAGTASGGAEPGEKENERVDRKSA